MKIVLKLVTLIIFIKIHDVLSQEVSIANQFLPEDAQLNFIQLAKKHGYSAEEHNVTTEDGYILRVFRIPGKRFKRPMLVMHGILDSADSWLLRGNSSPALYYAALGYDLWFPNIRGNKYSRAHIRLNPDKDQKFWDFSLDEHGRYDLAASIDLILKKTRSVNLSAIGHSQGNTMFYVLTSTRPEYNSKIHLLIALAPICYLHNLRSPLSLVIALSPLLYRALQSIGVTEVIGETSPLTVIVRLFCSQPVIGYLVCVEGVAFPIVGRDPDQLEASFVPVLLGHYPTGVSLKNLYHFAQISLRKQFSRFDYGFQKNLMTYGSPKPPDYDLKKVTIKVALIAADNDKLAPLENVDLLKNQLPNVVKYIVNKYPNYNHVDYVLARENEDLLVPYINKILEAYN
ncbi:lipase 1-like [Battus philenor]|uniref:lipase 1-like n=1 Tax=Battus philenor TaxID=42288 RepID=UPI0035CEE12B